MSESRAMIAAFLELNRSADRNVALFTPSLVGMFGSINIFDTFLNEVDSALASGGISEPLKRRAANLIGTFIPQVADYNGIKDLTDAAVTADRLRNITPASLDGRRQGVIFILSALITILTEVKNRA